MFVTAVCLLFLQIFVQIYLLRCSVLQVGSCCIIHFPSFSDLAKEKSSCSTTLLSYQAAKLLVFHNLSQRFRLIKIFERATSISCCESRYNITQLSWSDKNSFNFTFQ